MDFHDDFEEDFFDSAIQKYEEAKQAQESFYFDREEYVEIMDYYLSQNHIEKAEQALGYAKAQHPYSLDIKIYEAKICLSKGALTKALRLLDELEKIDCCSPELLMTKGSVLSRLKQSEKALEYYQKALSFCDFKEDVYWLIALEYQSNMNYKLALKFHLKALEENPENEIVLSEIGLCYECLEDHEGAVKFYKNYLDDYPYNEMAWYSLGMIYSNMEEYLEAINCYEFCIAISPEFSSTAFFNKASLLCVIEEYDKAIETYFEAFEFEEPNSTAYAHIGECYEKKLDFDRALEYYTKAIDLSKNNEDAWLGIAICLSHKESHLEALNAINKAIALDENEVDFYYTKAEILEHLKDIENAGKCLERSIELDGSDLDLKLDYLEFLKRHYEIQEVLHTVELFLEENKNEKLLYYKVAVLLEMKKFALAYHLFERALANDFSIHQLIFKFHEPAIKDQNILELIDLYR